MTKTAATTQLPHVAKTASWIEARIHKQLTEDRRATNAVKSHRLAFSQIGKCERDLWAGIHGIPSEREPEGRILVLFDLGEAVESHLISLLQASGFIVNDTDENCAQIRITAFEDEDGNPRASGRLDGEIRVHSDEVWAVFEVKSASRKKFDELLEAGSYEAWNPVYYDQVQMYMGLRKRARTLVAVECRDDSRLRFELVDFNPGRFGQLYTKASRIVSSGEILDRPAVAKSQYCAYCKWCDRNKWCWGPLAGVRFEE